MIRTTVPQRIPWSDYANSDPIEEILSTEGTVMITEEAWKYLRYHPDVVRLVNACLLPAEHRGRVDNVEHFARALERRVFVVPGRERIAWVETP